MKECLDLEQARVCPPIMICGFKRPDSLRLVFDAVRRVKPQQLFLVLDAPRPGREDDVSGFVECKKIFDQVDWECDVRKNYAAKNMGCGLRMTSGISWVFEHVDRAIILEDDCVPDLTFFRFCAELLEYYKSDSRVGMIAGHDEHLHLAKINTYGDSYYFDRMVTIWGWATWRRAWVKHDPGMREWPFMAESRVLDNVFINPRYTDDWIKYSGALYRKERHTWAGAWAYTMYKEGWLSVHPSVNLISNVGAVSSRDDTGRRLFSFSWERENPWDRRPIIPMKFPLRHPKTMIANLKSEYYHLEDIHSPAWWRKMYRLPGFVVRCVQKCFGLA